MNILLVEDSLPVSIIIRSIAKSAGHEIIHAEDGETALDIFPRNQFDLVLMDVEMPGIDGYETTRRLRTILGDVWIPIIFLSGNTDEHYLAQGIEAGGDDYLSKPVKPRVLKAKINAMARISSIQDQLGKANHDLSIANEELQRLSCLDGLTSVVNRRGFDMQFSVEWRRCLRDMTALCVMMIDVDNFKPFNDHYGHLAGDDCLRNIAQAIKSELLRPGDIIARFGGEEFVVLLPCTEIEGAIDVANRIMQALEKANIAYPDGIVADRSTISMGICCSDQLTKEDESNRLLEFADAALYEAKSKGRNQYCVYTADEKAV